MTGAGAVPAHVNFVAIAISGSFLLCFACLCVCVCVCVCVADEMTAQVSKLMVPNPTRHIVADVQVCHHAILSRVYVYEVHQCVFGGWMGVVDSKHSG